ncbi:MAG: gephyrin-like molybdotransferase Glp [Candidatus Hodarchaeota archaeon]
MKNITMKGFDETTDIKTALNIFLPLIKFTCEVEEINTNEGLYRILAEDIHSPVNIPRFNKSAMDGYAVRAKDTFGASETNPLTFSVVDSIAAGQTPTIEVEENQAIMIMTGGELPPRADAVVMFEYTNRLDENTIEVYRPVVPKENISLVGEDVRQGDTILRRGTILEPQDIGMLYALNTLSIKVFEKPRIAIVSIGDELVEPGEPPPLGKIINTNTPMIQALTRKLGGSPIDLGIARDDSEEIKTKIMEGTAKADILILIGGTSVGKKDLAPGVVDSAGKLVVHGMSMRPGKPTGLGIVKEKPVILVPGNPVAAMISVCIFGNRVIQKISGLAPERIIPPINARMTRRIPSNVGRRDFARVLVKCEKGKYVAEPIRVAGSSILSSMVKANGIVVVPENKEGIEEGEEVEVLLIRQQIEGEII